MKKNEVKKLLPIITAFANGKKIEYLYKDGIWREQNNLSFCNLANRYRIKPEIEYIPFSFEDAEQLIGKIIKLKGENYEAVELILIVTSGEIGLFGGRTMTYKMLFENFTFLDGSLCGKIKE